MADVEMNILRLEVELSGGPNDGDEFELVIYGSPSFEGAPAELYVGRTTEGTVCTSHALRGWEPGSIEQMFWCYRQTTRTNTKGRRVYQLER